MIYQEIIKDNQVYKFTFTDRHIYCFIHAIAETSDNLDIINKIIINYYNKVEIEKYKNQLLHHQKYDEIMSAIDNMMLKKPVIYNAINLSTRKLAWYNTLYMDQKSSNIMPPIVVPNSDFKLDFEASSY